MQPNSLVDLFVDLPPSLDVVRRKPAAHPIALQIAVEPLGKLLVLGRIAYEAGVKLDGTPHHRANVGDELVGNAAAAQEHPGNTAVGLVDCVDANGGWPLMFDCFEAFGIPQIDISEVSFPCGCLSKIGTAEVRPTEARPAKVRTTKAGLNEASTGEARLAKVRPMEVRPKEVRSSEVRRAEPCAAEVRFVEVRLTQDRVAEVRFVEVRLAEVRLREVGFGELRPTEIWNDVGIVLPPLIPLLDPLLEDCEMFRVRHAARC